VNRGRSRRGNASLSALRGRTLASLVSIASLGGGVLQGCRRSPPPEPPAAALSFEYAGCAAVVAPGTCELPPDGAIRVWVAEEPASRVTFSAPAGEIAATAAPIAGGTLYRLNVPLATREIALTTKTARGRIAMIEPPAAWVREARSLRQKGKLDDAERLTRPALASSGGERAVALGLIARIELARGHTEEAVRAFREAIAADREAGRMSDRVDDATSLAFTLNQRGRRYAEARAVLDDVTTVVRDYAVGRARLPYYRAMLAVEVGDGEHALADAARARDDAHKLGMTALERDARHLAAVQLRQLGRWREALDALRALEEETQRAPDASPCQRAVFAYSLGFSMVDRLGAQDDGGEPVAALDPIAPFERALQAAATCADPHERATAREGLAFALIEVGRTAEARAHLAEARREAGEARGWSVLRGLEIEGRAALAEGNGREALRLFEQQLRVASQFDTPQRWRAATARAEALELLGKLREAAIAYGEAEALLDEGSARVVLGEGRDTFVGGRERSARLGVDLLLRLGRTRDAFTMARAARRRVLASVERAARLAAIDGDARARWEASLATYRLARDRLDAEAKDDWKLPAPELEAVVATRRGRERELQGALEAALGAVVADTRTLRAPADGEAWLGFFSSRSGWIGFVADTRAVAAFPISTPLPADPEARATAILAPASAAIARARRLRVLPYGLFRAIDLHALPWKGQPLVASIPIEYALDLPLVPLGGAPTTALVVADPNGNLTGGRNEAKVVAAGLRGGAAWEIHTLEGEEATRGALLAQLAQSQLFHYAGHGIFAGADGAESALLLAGGGRLTLGDVLSLAHVPERVVLSGCETARASDASRPEGLGLAQAFLAAGARFVVAPVREVDDALSLGVAEALYGPLARPDGDPAEALRLAQIKLASACAEKVSNVCQDWSAFRVTLR
jgi:tetratricopeptide (TPR) repeat protein